MYSQKINIKEGWNLVSFILFDVSFDDIISNQQILEIKTLNKSYNKILSRKLNTLSTIETDKLYWVKSDSDFALISYGEILNLDSIKKNEAETLIKNLKDNLPTGKVNYLYLKEGWNQISFNLYNIDLNKLIEYNEILEIRSLNKSYNKILAKNLNTLKNIKVEEGYFIKSKSDIKIEVFGTYYNIDLIDSNLEIRRLKNKFQDKNDKELEFISFKSNSILEYLEKVYNFERDLNKIKVDTDLVTHLNLSTSDLDSIEEINIFNNLKTLNINDTNVKNIEKVNPSLEELYCNNCPIVNINILENNNLKILECRKTLIKELDLENNKSLLHLNCKDCNELEKIYLKDLKFPHDKDWIKDDFTKYVLRNIIVDDKSMMIYLKKYHGLNTYNNIHSINSEQVKKIDLEKYLKESEHNEIENLDSLKNFEKLEILNINNSGFIQELDLRNNKNLKILKLSNSIVKKINIEDNYLLETIECENTQLDELNLPKTKVIVDSTESKVDFSVSKIGGLNNIEKKVFYGRIANEKDRLNYKFRHYGFLELGDLFINDLPIQQKKFNNVNHVVLKFSDFNKYNLKNIINYLPFTLKVYKFPNSKPQQFIFNYDKSVDYYPYLISKSDIEINEIIYSYKVEILFNNPNNESYFLDINKVNFINEPVEDSKYNLLVYDNDDFFKKYEVLYNSGRFKTNKNILNLSKKYKFVISNSNLSILNCSKNKIKELMIEDHTNLINLNASNNNIGKINLLKNKNLKKLNLSVNFLKDINLTCNSQLEELFLNFNFIQNIDLTNNQLLKELQISNNLLTELDITKNIGLKKVIIPENNLISLDISKNVELEKLQSYNNCINQINIENNKKLKLGENDIGKSDRVSDDIKNHILLDKIEYNIVNKFIGQTTNVTFFLNDDEKLLYISNLVDESCYPKENSIIIEKPLYKFYSVDKILDVYKLPDNSKKYTIKLKGDNLKQNTLGTDFYLLDHFNFNLLKDFKLLQVEDKKFCKYLEKLGGRKVSDNEIFIDVNNIFHIDISKIKIKSISEIKFFPNLLTLKCDSCEISKLNTSFNKNLFYLNCSNNPIEELDITGNNKLAIFFGYGLEISKLNLTNNPELIYINLISNRKLEELDLRNFNNDKIEKLLIYQSTNLNRIHIDTYKYHFNIPRDCLFVDNEIHSHLIENHNSYYENKKLIIPKVEEFESLFLSNNGIEEIFGLEVLYNLKRLIIFNSQVRKIDLKEIECLDTINFTDLNNIKEVDLSHNKKLKVVIFYNNKNLETINLANNNNDIIECLRIGACPKLKKVIIDKRTTKLPKTWEFDDKVKFEFLN